MVRKRYRIFRYLLFLFILLFMAGAAVASVVLNREKDKKESYEMNIVLDDCIECSSPNRVVQSYRLTLTSPTGEESVVNLPKEIGKTTRSVSLSGIWRVTAEALNPSGGVIGEGKAEVSVGRSRECDVNIIVKGTATERGTLSVSLDAEGSFVMRIYSSDGSEFIGEVKFDGDKKGEASLDGGEYVFMILSSYNNSNVLAREKVRIEEGETISFCYEMDDDGLLSLLDASLAADGLTLTLSSPVLHEGESVTVSLEGGKGNLGYEWYRDGERLDSSSSSVVISDLKESGGMEILCLVRSSSGILSAVSRKVRVYEKGSLPRIGLAVINDESDQGYTMNFLDSMERAVSFLNRDGYPVEVLIKKGVREDDSAREANAELAQDGCEIIFNNSYGFEPYMLSVASVYPETLFVSITNCESQSDGRENTYNAFAAIYEGRYVSGVAAGMKLNEMIEKGEIRKEDAIVGYVGTYTLGEVISGMTAYFLGVRSVCPSARMIVFFVDTWGDMTLEEAATDSLIDNGAVIISQHSDTITPALSAQKKGVYHTGYNSDMTMVAPLSSIISCRIDWTRYFYSFIRNYLDGIPNPSDWTGTMKEGDVVMTPLNSSLAAEKTEDAVEETVRKIVSGELDVFDTSTFTIDGRELVHAYALDTDGDFVADSGEAVWDGVFHESFPSYQSSPYFRFVIDGIEWLNESEK